MAKNKTDNQRCTSKKHRLIAQKKNYSGNFINYLI